MGSGEDSSSQLLDRVGTLINDRYRVLRLIGSGSTGAVYLCQHEGLDKWVALKILHREMEQNASLVDRFKLEAKAASRLEHPNSVRVLDFGHDTVTGALFIAMEYIEGRDLLQVLEEDGPFSAERAVSVMCQILDVLGVAHSLGIVHRDLKPENIIVRPVEEDGAVRELVTVCDFGIAQFAPRRGGGGFEHENTGDDGVVAGTPAYMSPEQARAEVQDARSDLYSAGVVLYQLMTLHLPFEADDAYELALKHCVEVPPPPSSFGAVNPQLEEVCLKALAKSKNARYQTAREMRVALTRALMATPVPLSEADTMPIRTLTPGRHWGQPRPLLPQSTPPSPLENSGHKRFMQDLAAGLPRQRSWLWSYTLGAAAVVGLIFVVQLYRNRAETSAKRTPAERQHMVRPSTRTPAANTETDTRASIAVDAFAGHASQSGSAELPLALAAPANHPHVTTPAPAPATKPARASAREPNGYAAASAPEPPAADSPAPAPMLTAADFVVESSARNAQEHGDVGHPLPAGGGDSASGTESAPRQGPVLTQTQPATSQDGEGAAGARAHPRQPTPVAVVTPAKGADEAVAATKKRARPEEPASAEHAAAAHESLASVELVRTMSTPASATPAPTPLAERAERAAEDKRPEEPAIARPSTVYARAELEPQLRAASDTRRPASHEPALIERAHVEISGIAAKSAVSKSSIRNALNVSAMSECYRTALRGGGLSGEPLTGQIELTTSTSGSVTGANLEAPGLPGELRRCVEQVARRGRVREADTGAAQASITLAFRPR